MGAVPNSKVSRRQRGNRRQHQRLKAPSLMMCPKCGAWKQTHRVCKSCGTYRGRQVIKVKSRES